jgi:hypothetical protein
MEFPGPFVNVTRFVLEGERGGPGAGREAFDEGQIADQFIRQAVGEVIVRWIMTQIVERQNRNGQCLARMKAPPAQSYRCDHQNSRYSGKQNPGISEAPDRRLIRIVRESPKHRDVTAPGELDHYRIGLAFSLIILAQTSSQATSFRPNDGILLRVIVCGPTENLDPNYDLLHFISAATQLIFDHESQEGGEALITGESGTRKDSIHLTPNRELA